MTFNMSPARSRALSPARESNVRRRRVVFRVDASVELGVGHLIRCHTLATAMAERDWDIGFACSAATAEIAASLSIAHCGVHVMPPDVEQEPEAMRNVWHDGTDALIVDHYHRDERYEAACHPWAERVVAIDDTPLRRHHVDMLLDQTLGRAADEYRSLVPSGARLAVGNEYILLRPEIAQRRGADRVPAVVRNLVVTFGGSDSSNLSARALAALEDSRLEGIATVLVVGPTNPRRNKLSKEAPANVVILSDFDSFPDILARADLALSAAGTTCWELAYLGVPSVLITDGPGNVAQSLQAAGAARWLGNSTDVDSGMIADELASLVSDAVARQAMADAGRRIVDGRGPERAAAAIESIMRP